MKLNSKFISRLCMLLLGLLGFASCSDEKEDMYGTPYGTFEVKGKVTDSQGNPVAGAVIRAARPESPSGIYSIATTVTGIEGSFVLIKKNETPYESIKIVCLPKGNGLEADSTIVGLKYTGGNGWDSGFASSEVDFKLKDKQE